MNVLAGLLRGFSPGCVFLYPSDEFFTAFRVMDVLNADVDALLDVPVADLLVDNDADGGLGDVVDDAGLAMVDLVWHTLLLGAVASDIDDVSNLVLLQVSRQRNHARILEATGEGIAGTGPETT